MGVDMYVGRISGRISRDDTRRSFILFKNGKFRRAKSNEDEDPRLVYDDEGLVKNLTKAVSEEYYDKLESDLYETFNRCRISQRAELVMGDTLLEFWKWVDEWTNDRNNQALIAKIKEYTF